MGMEDWSIFRRSRKIIGRNPPPKDGSIPQKPNLSYYFSKISDPNRREWAESQAENYVSENLVKHNRDLDKPIINFFKAIHAPDTLGFDVNITDQHSRTIIQLKLAGYATVEEENTEGVRYAISIILNYDQETDINMKNAHEPAASPERRYDANFSSHQGYKGGEKAKEHQTIYTFDSAITHEFHTAHPNAFIKEIAATVINMTEPVRRKSLTALLSKLERDYLEAENTFIENQKQLYVELPDMLEHIKRKAMELKVA